MTLHRADLIATRDLAKEVATLCDKALEEAAVLEVRAREWRQTNGLMHKVNPLPDHPGGTVLSGTIRRRSLDLTRALAQLRGRTRR